MRIGGDIRRACGLFSQNQSKVLMKGPPYRLKIGIGLYRQLWRNRKYNDRFAAVPFVVLSGCAAVQETEYVSRGVSCPGHISVNALAFRVFFSHQFISPTYRLLTFPPPVFLVRASIAS